MQLQVCKALVHSLGQPDINDAGKKEEMDKATAAWLALGLGMTLGGGGRTITLGRPGVSIDPCDTGPPTEQEWNDVEGCLRRACYQLAPTLVGPGNYLGLLRKAGSLDPRVLLIMGKAQPACVPGQKGPLAFVNFMLADTPSGSAARARLIKAHTESTPAEGAQATRGPRGVGARGTMLLHAHSSLSTFPLPPSTQHVRWAAPPPPPWHPKSRRVNSRTPQW